MWTYLARRLLLTIPTLLGVTIVTFLVMQLAPGDPLLAQIDSGGTAGQSTQTREAYLLQKRDLRLDKPILLNFRSLGDYRQGVRWAAYYEAIAEPNALAKQTAVIADLNALAAGAGDPKLLDDDARARLAFLRSLGIPKFEEQFASPDERERLASAVVARVHGYSEDLGADGATAAIELLRGAGDNRQTRLGAIRVLRRMVADPFVFTYSRTPSDAQTPLVTLSWRLWWDRNKDQFAPLDAARRAELTEKLHALAGETSRQRMFERLEEFQKSDSPFLVEIVLGDSPLNEKAIAALALKLYNGPPLSGDVSADASDAEIDRVTVNWLENYGVREAEFSPSTPRKIWNIVGDTQYSHMLWRLATFNFGRSALKTHEPVSRMIWRAVTVSAPLMLMAELLIYFVAVPLGILCAVQRGRLLDRLVSLGLFLLYSIPPFVAGMIFLLLFCYGDYLKWFPIHRLHSDAADQFGLVRYVLDYLHHAVLPVLCLSLFSMASLAMYSRGAMLDVLGQDYIRTARAKGLSRMKVVFKHALRNGLIPIITLFANSLPALLGGSVLVEYLFNLPGMGGLGYESINRKDFPTVMALVYIEAIVVLLSILASDVLYVLVDPRISFSGREKSE